MSFIPRFFFQKCLFDLFYRKIGQCLSSIQRVTANMILGLLKIPRKHLFWINTIFLDVLDLMNIHKKNMEGNHTSFRKANVLTKKSLFICMLHELSYSKYRTAWIRSRIRSSHICKTRIRIELLTV